MEFSTSNFFSGIKVGNIIFSCENFSLQAYVGSRREFSEDVSLEFLAWKKPLNLVEVIIHEKFNLKTLRHDIAVGRLDYPIIDTTGKVKTRGSKNAVQVLVQYLNICNIFVGISILSDNTFSRDSIMPICLPETSSLRDGGKGLFSIQQQNMINITKTNVCIKFFQQQVTRLLKSTTVSQMGRELRGSRDAPTAGSIPLAMMFWALDYVKDISRK